jgi:hypothetical protein
MVQGTKVHYLMEILKDKESSSMETTANMKVAGKMEMLTDMEY